MAAPKRKYKLLQFIAVPLLIGGTVFAQQATDDQKLRGAANLSGQEQRAQAEKHLGKMREVQGRVTKLLDTARKEKDVIKLNCVNEKLTEIKGNLNIADSSHKNLGEAVSRNDHAGRTHEYSKILVIGQKVSVLGAEAEQCVGEDIRYTGNTTVVTEGPSNLPEDPTRTDPPLPFFPRPPDASAVQ